MGFAGAPRSNLFERVRGHAFRNRNYLGLGVARSPVLPEPTQAYPRPSNHTGLLQAAWPLGVMHSMRRYFWLPRGLNSAVARGALLREVKRGD